MVRHVKEFMQLDNGTHQCALCNGVIHRPRKKILEDRFGCPHCGNYVGITDELIVEYHRSVPLDISPRYRVTAAGQILTGIGHLRYRLLDTNEEGYKSVKIRGKKLRINRLVAFAFIGPAPSDMHEVHHINHIRDDNREENLQWVTRQENIDFAKAHRRNQKPDNSLARSDLIKLSYEHFNIEELVIITQILQD